MRGSQLEGTDPRWNPSMFHTSQTLEGYPLHISCQSSDCPAVSLREARLLIEVTMIIMSGAQSLEINLVQSLGICHTFVRLACSRV